VPPDVPYTIEGLWTTDRIGDFENNRVLRVPVTVA
jgi:hypothetical protein